MWAFFLVIVSLGLHSTGHAILIPSNFIVVCTLQIYDNEIRLSLTVISSFKPKQYLPNGFKLP